jgi:hypothetical protein
MVDELIISLFTPGGFSNLLHFLVLILQILYLIFSLLVVRQVKVLNASFRTSAAYLFTLFSYLHLFFAFALVVLSLLTLLL